MSATLPVIDGNVAIVAGGVAQASFAVVCVPVRTRSSVPESAGTPVVPDAGPHGWRTPFTDSAYISALVLSKAATPITFAPTPGAPADQRLIGPLFPIDATTFTPRLASAVAAFAVGASGQLLLASPMLMFRTFIPSRPMRSIAAIMMSLLVSPSQPKTR